jgi:cyclic pyranopterin phosphate synthase
MKDNYGREIDYLRVSVTTRCNLNCVYCGKADCDKKLQELPPKTIAALVRGFVCCGVKKVRVTGGEPLVRSDICEIVEAICALPGVETVGLTTNGVLLEQYAKPLYDAGLRSVNISLDSTDGSTYRRLTGADVLDKVLRGIDAAQKAGLTQLKINAVLMRGVNDDGAGDLIALAKDSPIDVRFIELMPFSGAGEDNDRRVTGDELLRQFSFLRPLETQEAATARYYTAEGFRGRIGFISPVTHQFCDRCSRVRLLANGRVKPCLAFDDSYDLLAYLEDEAALAARIRDIILKKPAGHAFGSITTTHGLNRTGG